MRIGRYAACFLFALSASALAADPPQPAQQEAALEQQSAQAVAASTGAAGPGNVEAGAAKAAPCAACHSLDGNSSDPQYPKIAGQHERYIARQLSLFKSGERENPVMQPLVAPLNAQDMRDIGAYYASKQGQAGLADDSRIGDTDETWIQRGERLYRGGDMGRKLPACMACHGPTGRGNPGAAYPSLAGQHASYTRDLLKRFRAGTSFGKDDRANTIMADVAAALDDQDIEALASYIEGLHRAEPAAAKVAGK